MKDLFKWGVIILLLVLSAMVYWNYFNTYSEGNRSGILQKFSKKGNIFKTYEGKLIQTGFRSKTLGSVQSYEFEFSVTDDSLAKVLMTNSGNYYDLHYKEYKGAIPWRGYSVFIVDKIIGTKPVAR